MVISDDEDSRLRDLTTLFESNLSSTLHEQVNATGDLFI
jgi:hypothetical protein